MTTATTSPRRIQHRRTTGWAVTWTGHADQHKPLGLSDHIPADDQRDAHACAVELYELWLRHHPALLDRAFRLWIHHPLRTLI
ncbi:hypothetical protein F0L17_14130 [Streptomyces sp. TRM43335]|uniref:Uncharacterized protein n=1 Tax=Streptomyces taklimakanensis TaxID=2569853 RepID=A0A6G2BD64_9ACTN|nr:hypothetical protein [Streptomyces taklimakanensis]MTE20225.1 hypothetical protein [Streptomyces taklimakanensis]